MMKKRLGLIVGPLGILVLVGMSWRDAWVSDGNAPAGRVEESRSSRQARTPKAGQAQRLPPPRAEEAVVRREGPSSETDRFLVLGKKRQLKLELDKLQLHRVFDDGTTQYTYEGGTLVTILPDGEVLLLPEEI
ncbi:hypothetical protein [Cystobacter ferrugineus]|uniref:Uncharacterized protein n=1 Tax=Cystobacter ferrugineus TaxID=83449 RepID=A0A1L9B3V2_9BACT|nr:hypothetical protein [Cystobacter ferrugineus]OJH36949.1 hypothetical protein BON30_31145 [Cystobacter ferrugineus]